MRVLIVANRRPDPAGTGDAKMAYHATKALLAHGDVPVVVFARPERAIKRVSNAVVAGLVGHPLQLGYARSSYLERVVRRICAEENIDCLIAVHARAAAHVPFSQRPRTIALLIDAYGRSYKSYEGRLPVWLDLVYRAEARRMAHYEQEITNQFGRIAVIADPDLHHLRAAGSGGSRVVRVTYPIDLDYFSETVRRPLPQSPLFTFVGRLNYLPNRDAAVELATHVWPKLRARWPQARLKVVGAQPDMSLVRQLAQSGVELAKDVIDVREEIEQATAMVVPMRMGSGVQTKILEAMAARIPVICSGFAAAGITARPGKHLLLAEAPEQYVQQAEQLIDDPMFQSQLVSSARSWVSSHHSPGAFQSELIALCQQVASQPESTLVKARSD